MQILFWVILSTTVVSLAGLGGALLYQLLERRLRLWTKGMVSLAAGSMLGVTFLHTLPEVAHSLAPDILFPLLLVALVIFFLIEKVLHWRHCHDHECQTHTSFGVINLVGDGIHNFIDGILIGAAFQVSIPLGFFTSVAVLLHELPQEMSDFGVLLFSGYTKKKAIVANMLISLTAVIGGVLGFFISSSLESVVPYLLLLAAGSFIYIGAVDLIPEIKESNTFKEMVGSFGLFVVGILLMYGLQLIPNPGHDDHASEIHSEYEGAVWCSDEHEEHKMTHDGFRGKELFNGESFPKSQGIDYPDNNREATTSGAPFVTSSNATNSAELIPMEDLLNELQQIDQEISVYQ